MLKRDKSIVPVVMFHSVGRRNENWIWSGLTESIDIFESILRGIAARGFRTCRLEELFDHMSGRQKLPDNSIVLTLDDGYLDNWSHVIPLLRKYGMNATVYVTPEFVQESTNLRPMLDMSVDGSHREPVPSSVGFMNWEELKAADSEGVLDVQSHALTHTWYFSGPRIVDLHRPNDVQQYPWLLWNVRPDRKPYYLTEDQQHFLPWGYPVLEHQKSLVTRQFFPEREQIDLMVDFVQNHGGSEFFEHDQWMKKLLSATGLSTSEPQLAGSYETEVAFGERVLEELVKSREILEQKLGKTVEFLSWPGGGTDEKSAELARQAGYKSWTLSSWQNPQFRNLPGGDPSAIKRVSGHAQVWWRHRLIKDRQPSWVVNRLVSHQGALLSKVAARSQKFRWIAESLLAGR